MAVRRGLDNMVSDADTGGGIGRRVQYWNIKENDSEILRFLDDADAWYVIRQHVFFPTKGAPKDAKNAAKWPKGMTAVCRKDPAFAGEYSTCPLCDAIKDYSMESYGKPMKTKSMVFALAVRREKVICDGSEEMGGPANKGKKAIIDRTVELDELDSDGKPTGNKKTVPDIRIVSNTMYSLFGNLKSAYEVYDSVVDRDFSIKREKAANGTGTVHVAVALDVIPSLQPGEKRWETYTEALDFYGLDLGEMLEKQAGDDFLKRFFLGDDGRAIVPADQRGKEAETTSDTSTVDDADPDYQAQLKSVKDRLAGKKSEPVIDFA